MSDDLVSKSQAQAEISALRAENEALKSQLSAPLDRLKEEGKCPTNHARVEILARVDESTVGAVGTDLPLMWSPICRDCGQDVPMFEKGSGC
jgi:hypothetical protein